ncbi:DNA-binding response regulator, OmpR family, contains REC and winged-helix (wHTH) domain [Ruminococcaceae bacterium KH2T8]|nr:DNA-binding response regulator, OmpR family, contains REC and winged-helix (wHTH) domain [Ruminococcaceae bacterium KH2T8]
MKKVLLVDDDAGIIEVLRLYFEKEGYQVSVCMQGDKALATFNIANPDIVILDLMLPGMDGNDICREIRKISDVPIIMLTARTDTIDKVVGFELGADDYVAKPFEPKELLARVKAVMRRYEKTETTDKKVVAESSTPEEGSEVITYPGFSVDKVKYVVTVDGKEIYMPPKELELLFFLASNPNRVFTREQLLENVWGYDFYGESRTVDVHVKRIREKIENPDREQNWCIKTVWSKGYKFETK